MLNPEESQNEDDNVVVTEASERQLLGEAEVRASEGWTGGAWCRGLTRGPPTGRELGRRRGQGQ